MNTITVGKRILAILIDYCIAFLALLGIGCAVAAIFGLFRIRQIPIYFIHIY